MRVLLAFCVALFCCSIVTAQTFPSSFKKISALTGGMTTPPNPGARFGIECVAIGDLDDDGIIDLAVGATNNSGFAIGAVYVMFMKADGTVKSNTVIYSSEAAVESDSFGSSVSALGDLDDDGVEDLGVGTQYDDDGGTDNGAFWVLFMKKDGSVKSRQKISAVSGNLGVGIGSGAGFGSGSAVIGDLDGDGNNEVAVGARFTSTTYILFLNNNGTVKTAKTISSVNGLPIDSEGLVSYGLAGIGDINGDGIPDLAIGGHRSDFSFTDSGVVYVVLLNSTGGVKSFKTITTGMNNFTDNAHLLGVSIAGIGDWDGDGVRDMIVGGDDSGQNTGAVWFIMLKADGSVKSFQKISSKTPDVDLQIQTGDFFGSSITYLGDIDSNGIPDLAIGAFQDDDGGGDTGAIWISVPRCGQSDAGPDIVACSAANVAMDAVLEAGKQGTWSVVSGAGSFVNINDPKSSVKDLDIGENRFMWTVKSGACSLTDVVKITVKETDMPDAGEDQYVCEGTLALAITGNTSNNRDGRWDLISGSGVVVNSSTASTIVKNPGLGVNKFTWTFLENSFCPAISDTMQVIVRSRPSPLILMPDTTYTCSERIVLKASKAEENGEWSIESGTGTIADAGSNETTIDLPERDKPINVKWEVSLDGCPPSENTAVIMPLSFNSSSIPNVITPNNDGKNDHWKIKNIEHFENEIRLYNRWGAEVLKASNYKNDWSRTNVSPGLYYFLLNIPECRIEVKGWLNIIE